MKNESEDLIKEENIISTYDQDSIFMLYKLKNQLLTGVYKNKKYNRNQFKAWKEAKIR